MPASGSPAESAAELLRRHADSDAPALHFGDHSWTYREMVAEASRRAHLFAGLRTAAAPPHVGVLLDNGPEYLFWLAGAALSGGVVVGVNSTYRGDQLGLLMRHTDCQVLVTALDQEQLLDGVDSGVAAERTLLTDTPEYDAALAAQPVELPAGPVGPDDLFLLIFTSGTTGLPKAVRCTQGRFARTGLHVSTTAALTEDDVVYTSLPFFHSSSLFTGWSAALAAAIPIAARARFSASNTLPDVRRYGATLITYTGKVLNYILATPEQPDDADNPLRLAFGNEASARDIKEFARRYGCTVRDSYGSTEGIIIIRRDPSMPDGSIGRSEPTVKVLDAETGQECACVVFDAEGRPTNLDEAVGEIVETAPSHGFEGYYNNEAATHERFRDGQYWSGDLAYRDAEGGCTSRAARTTGCASTGRTSPRLRSRRSSAATTTCDRSPSTRYRTTRSVTA